MFHKWKSLLGVLLAFGLVLMVGSWIGDVKAQLDDAAPPPTLRAGPDNAAKPGKSLDDSAMSVLAQNRFRQASIQKESVDFLWVPGDLLWQNFGEDSNFVYPE